MQNGIKGLWTNKDFWNLKNKVDVIKPWLILGKGPSLEKFDSRDYREYNILTLNHVGGLVDSTICILHDIEVLTFKLSIRPKFILVPYHPHMNFRPIKGKYAPPYNSVYQFNLSTWKGVPESSSPVVRAKYNVAESAFHILALFGVKTIYSLGVDGGKDYASCFKNQKPLTNGQPNFNKQLGEIRKTCRKYNIRYRPL